MAPTRSLALGSANLRGLSLAVVATVTACTSSCCGDLLSIEVDSKHPADFSVKLSGQTWLENGELRAYINGKWQKDGDGISHVSSTENEGYSLQRWTVSGLPMTTSLTKYDDDVYIFEQGLPQGAAGTQASKPSLPGGHATEPGMYPPIVAFPSFRGAAPPGVGRWGFVSWEGCMVNEKHTGPWSGDITTVFQGLQGLSGGPLVIYNASNDGRDVTTLIVSPLDNFKQAVNTLRVNNSTVDNAWETGVSSEVSGLPFNFSHRTIVVAGKGITDTINKWGMTVRAIHKTERLTDTDLVTNYLGYWTDNGAYYYGDHYQHNLDCCNESKLASTAQHLREQGIPIRYWQMDDWWYPGAPKVWVDCVEDWSLIESSFPSGLPGLREKLGVPLLLYVPFFCPNSTYTKDFKFVLSTPGTTQFAEPHPDNSEDFYNMLFSYGLNNGMTSFENDFLNFNMLSVPAFRTNFSWPDRWLGGINAAALAQTPQVPFQMCMALPSDLLASVKLDSVTNYRASTDYANADNFDIGGSALLAFGLGLRPSKDNFWTHRADDSWGEKNPGRNCELNAIIALLSTGPVGIADKDGDTNKTLIMRTCTTNGLLLQPDKPATLIDWAISGSHSTLQMWGTYAMVSSMTWHYSLGIDVVGYTLSPLDTWPEWNGRMHVGRFWHQRGSTLALDCVNGTRAVATNCVQILRFASDFPTFNTSRPTVDPQFDSHKFDLYSISPVDEGSGWVVLGELNKYIGVSAKRFKNISFGESGPSFVLSGASGEEVTVTALKPLAKLVTQEWMVVSQTFTIPGSGTLAANWTSHLI